MNKKRKKLLILSIVLIPFLLPSCCYFCRKETESASRVCPKKRVNVGWTIIKSGTDETLRGILGRSHSDIITVGDKGTIRICRKISNECDVMECTPMPIKENDTKKEKKKNLRDICGYFQGDMMHLFSVGDGTIKQYEGPIGEYEEPLRKPGRRNKNKKTGWEEMEIKTDLEIRTDLMSIRGIWGDFQGGETNLFAVSDEGIILYYYDSGKKNEDNGKKKFWIARESITKENLNDIWGIHKEDFFIVGNRGTILHYKDDEDEKWSTIETGTYKNLNGIWGSSRKNIFAVGDGGTILQYEDGKWREMDSPASENLNAVWGRSPRDVFAVGDRGIILHYNGNPEKKWRKLPSPTAKNLHDVWISNNPHVFVVGEDEPASHEYAAIYGFILDSTTGNGIEDAMVQRLDGGVWVPIAPIKTDQYGEFDYRSASYALESQETLKFVHLPDPPVPGAPPPDPAFYESLPPLTIDVADDHWFDIRTYLFPKVGFENSISGVISDVIYVEVPPNTFEYSQMVIDETNPIKVELYKKGCGSYPDNPECWVNITNGHYFFPNPTAIHHSAANINCNNSLPDGKYMIKPVQSGYDFYEEYDEIDIVVPHETPPVDESPKAYNFTRQQ